MESLNWIEIIIAVSGSTLITVPLSYFINRSLRKYDLKLELNKQLIQKRIQLYEELDKVIIKLTVKSSLKLSDGSVILSNFNSKSDFSNFTFLALGLNTKSIWMSDACAYELHLLSKEISVILDKLETSNENSVFERLALKIFEQHVEQLSEIGNKLSKIAKNDIERLHKI